MYVHIQFVFSFCFDVRRGSVCRFTISNSGTTESSNDYSECDSLYIYNGRESPSPKRKAPAQKKHGSFQMVLCRVLRAVIP